MGLLAQRGELTDRESLGAVGTPKATRTWSPVPHRFLLDTVEAQVWESGLGVGEQQHALSKDGRRYFGVLYCNKLLGPGSRGTSGWTVREGCRLAIGIRNSHDKSLSVAVSLGSEVTVCTNLGFCAEIILRRKHTRFIEREFPRLVRDAVSCMQQASVEQADSFGEFQATTLHQSTQVPSMLLALYRQGVLSSTMLGPVLDEITKRGDGFSLPVPFHIKVWDFYNACTRQLNKRVSGLEMSRRSVRLYNCCVEFCRKGTIWKG